MRHALLVLILASLPAVVLAKKPAEKYFVRVAGYEADKTVPAGLADRAKAILGKVLADRREFVTELTGAPDPEARPEAFKKWLRKKKIRAFDVVIKITAFERLVEPEPGSKVGKVLQVHVGLSLLGTGMPDKSMALAGDGNSTIKLECGAKVRPRDDEVAVTDALTGALGSAVEDAVQKLAAGPRTKPLR